MRKAVRRDNRLGLLVIPTHVLSALLFWCKTDPHGGSFTLHLFFIHRIGTIDQGMGFGFGATYALLRCVSSFRSIAIGHRI